MPLNDDELVASVGALCRELLRLSPSNPSGEAVAETADSAKATSIAQEEKLKTYVVDILGGADSWKDDTSSSDNNLTSRRKQLKASREIGGVKASNLWGNADWRSQTTDDDELRDRLFYTTYALAIHYSLRNRLGAKAWSSPRQDQVIRIEKRLKTEITKAMTQRNVDPLSHVAGEGASSAGMHLSSSEPERSNVPIAPAQSPALNGLATPPAQRSSTLEKNIGKVISGLIIAIGVTLLFMGQLGSPTYVGMGLALALIALGVAAFADHPGLLRVAIIGTIAAAIFKILGETALVAISLLLGTGALITGLATRPEPPQPATGPPVQPAPKTVPDIEQTGKTGPGPDIRIDTVPDAPVDAALKPPPPPPPVSPASIRLRINSVNIYKGVARTWYNCWLSNINQKVKIGNEIPRGAQVICEYNCLTNTCMPKTQTIGPIPVNEDGINLECPSPPPGC